MTNDERELAEWVARWAGWEPHPCNVDGCSMWTHIGLCDRVLQDGPEELFTDEALAWRALVELACLKRRPSLVRIREGYFLHLIDPQISYSDESATLVVFRALRAAREG